MAGRKRKTEAQLIELREQADRVHDIAIALSDAADDVSRELTDEEWEAGFLAVTTTLAGMQRTIAMLRTVWR